MSTLRLWFHRADTIELVKTEFVCSMTERTLVCVRGAVESRGEYSSFKWSPAVKGLALLMLQHRSYLLDHGNDAVPSLSGELGSPAASLDYALGKQPVWLMEMFGTDSSGRCVVRRLLRRINPERKRPGPVSIAVSSESLRVEVFLNDIAIGTAEEIRWIRESIEFGRVKNDFGKSEQNGALLTDSAQLPSTRFPQGLEEVGQSLWQSVREEISSSLTSTNIFNRFFLDRELKSIYESAPYRRVLKHQVPLVSEVDRSLYGTSRIAMNVSVPALRRSLGAGVIRCALTPAQVGSLAIFLHLRRVWNLPLEIDCMNTHTVEMTSRLRSGSELADLCAVSIAPACFLLRDRQNIEYEPFLLLPKTSYRLIAGASSAPKKKSGEKKWGGEIGLLCDGITSSSYFLDRLTATGRLARRSISYAHMEPDEAMARLSEGDPNLGMVQWFPYYSISKSLHGCISVSEEDSDNNLMPTVLFMSRSFSSDSARVRLLDLAIRGAWLELCESSHHLDNALDDIFTKTDFAKLLWRIARTSKRELNLMPRLKTA